MSSFFQAKNAEETDALLSTTFGECSRISEMAGHMYTLACRMVLSDLPADVAFRAGTKKITGKDNSL